MKKILIAVAVVMIAAFAVPAFAATNPFMDVPASHWAYDAVAQLASRGVISGYPDGSYKGAQPATRYEMASIVARAMAKIDMEKASKQDVEMLKKLIVEFKDELDALGVKVDGIDARLAVIEKDLGGWSLAGELRFDAKFGGEDNTGGWYSDEFSYTGKNEFDLNRYRIFLRKRINENTNFVARLGTGGASANSGNETMKWERYYITTKLPYDITLTVGRQLWDWEGDLGLYQDNDAWFGDLARNMLRVQKTWGMADFDLIVARNFDNGGLGIRYNEESIFTGIEQFMVAAKVGLDFNEKVMFGLMGYWYFTDEEMAVNIGGLNYETDTDLYTYGVYAGYSFTPSIQLKGIYYMQDQGDTLAALMTSEGTDYDDSANAWKAIIDVKQDALKFTSLWLEYGQMDNNFVMNAWGGDNGTGVNPYAWIGAELLKNRPLNTNTAKIWGARADQQWNDKWRSYLRYYSVDFDTDIVDDANNWTVGIAYRLNPNVEFELAYDAIDYGSSYDAAGNALQRRNGDDNVVRFRTYVTF